MYVYLRVSMEAFLGANPNAKAIGWSYFFFFCKSIS